MRHQALIFSITVWLLTPAAFAMARDLPPGETGPPGLPPAKSGDAPARADTAPAAYAVATQPAPLAGDIILAAPGGWTRAPSPEGGHIFTRPDGQGVIIASLQTSALEQWRDQFAGGFRLGEGIYLTPEATPLLAKKRLYGDFLVSGSALAARGVGMAHELPGGRTIMLLGLSPSGETASLRDAMTMLLQPLTQQPDEPRADRETGDETVPLADADLATSPAAGFPPGWRPGPRR